MAVQIATKSGPVRVAFNHDRQEFNGLRRRLTECQIIDLDNKILATGLARCSAKDRFSRANGRAYSFVRALVRGLRFGTMADVQVAELILNGGKLVRFVDLPTQERATLELSNALGEFHGYVGVAALNEVLTERKQEEAEKQERNRKFAEAKREAAGRV